ncbi:hypothetical protein NDU88_004499 [Pleurodeles waltl]|uniref:Uncharacterized protein n=1 Tax=Pleurodeles waltl TaxID=8319 RepID=A0AAV7L4X3_PLEWA|nr:hypothetical protein NDU88_004499 [Pleurodeles waltl]
MSIADNSDRRTHLIQHHIRTIGNRVAQRRPYRIPEARQKMVEQEAIRKRTSRHPMTESAQPEEGFLNPNTTATGKRPQRRRNKKTPKPGRQSRQPREDFPDAWWNEQEATKCTDQPRSGKSMA